MSLLTATLQFLQWSICFAPWHCLTFWETLGRSAQRISHFQCEKMFKNILINIAQYHFATIYIKEFSGCCYNVLQQALGCCSAVVHTYLWGNSYGLCCKLLKIQTRNFHFWFSLVPNGLPHSVSKGLGVQGTISFCSEMELKCDARRAAWSVFFQMPWRTEV